MLRVVGYHGSSPLLPLSNPVMLTEPCSVGYDRGSHVPPLGDQSTRGQRETQLIRQGNVLVIHSLIGHLVVLFRHCVYSFLL